VVDNPYEFLKPSKLSFFDENDGREGEHDLMGFEPDPDESHGMVQIVVDDARGVLNGLSSIQVRAILWAADMLLDVGLDEATVLVNDKPMPKSDIDFRRVNQLRFIHLVLTAFAKNRIAIGAIESMENQIEVTPLRFCAAFALRMAYNGTRECLQHDGASDLRGYYLMQASAAYGFMKSLQESGGDSVGDALSIAIRTRGSRDAAISRWGNDPKSRAMSEIRAEWLRRGRPGAGFAREMAIKYQNVGTDLSEGGIKNAISRWRRRT